MSDNDKNSLLDTLKPYPFQFEELPVDLIETDSKQPRKVFELRGGGDLSRLLKSIQHYGIEDPIKVSKIEDGRYIIMDGHRRYSCARELKFEKVPCRIYPKMNDGEFEARRYEMQNNRKDWRPIERANSLHKIRSEYKNANEKEIADLVGITQANLFHYTELRDTRLEYISLMERHKLKEYQQVGFTRLIPKLRRVKQYQVDDIIQILFQKINDNLLYRVSDFTTLSKVFSTASLNEEEIFKFLSDPQISTVELSEMTQLSGISTQIRTLIKDLGTKKNLGINLTEKEQVVFEDLYKLMQTFM
ncbi:ParB/RepB/Spo0J family partition protein [Soonwooa buanensis]|uniref:ParB/RepB/Spo0J family partition protein n=1 Tax=Soonwooa buanensis TaxID=619805 RepID=A0A1T5FUS2_9FLAO|nr:ParB/RepB/Spo0J family partition protein [Soonwooa buanensis]SKB99837.1 ParB/RepB/Spo0J family partition protein [Soonwooa buanensis]